MPAPPASYFSDLRALALLACSTWPAARHLSPDEDAASAIDQHIDSLREQAAARHAGSPGDASRTRADFTFPPADAAASGGLARIADRILAGSRDAVREQLLLLLPFGTRNAGQSRWGLSMTRMAIPCSEGLQAAYAPVLRTFTKTGGSRGRRDAVLRPGRWGLKNIPAFLPRDWYARHFMPIAGVSDRFIRRTAALRLVQMVAGGSLHDAAQCLGIASAGTAWPGYGIYTGASHVHSGARKQYGPLSFENALEALTRELGNPATPLADYQARRQALGDLVHRRGNLDEHHRPAASRSRPAAARSRGPETPARLHLRLGPGHLWRAPLRPAAYRGHHASQPPEALDPVDKRMETAGPRPPRASLHQPESRTRHHRDLACQDYR